MFTLPVRYCPKGDVHVQSGEPIRREKRHSKCTVDPGNTANSPPGSTDAEPEGILMRIVGGASSAIGKRGLLMSYIGHNSRF